MIKLFEHNEKAYEALVKCLEKEQMATINHATGTGKSFIILKYLYENRNKRILYICPTYYIFYQLIDEHMKDLGISYHDFFKLDNIIYSNMLKIDVKQIAENYDIIIFDEYHRGGAKEWYKKISQLLDLIKEEYPLIKVIGLTATNRRYLDNNRNMTDELFVGVCASTLSLETAILDGLLPPYIYINTPFFCYSKIDSLKKIIDKKVFYEKDKEYFNKKINTFIKNIEEKTLKIFMSQIKENGKYIVFNNSIKSISENKVRIKEWFREYDVNFIEVHSHQSKDKNKKNLKSFSESKEGISFLFVVDILNEGIHVKDVDGIIMLRHTTSPIIYFQQIGRLLSFSRRNDHLVVLDMVDNLNSHNVITSLYTNVISEAKRRIKDSPDSIQRYQRILDNFKIVDKSIEIKEQLNKLEEELSKENIAKRRINTAISIFEHTNSICQKIQAHLDIFNFSDYVDENQYRKIKKLGIVDTIFDCDYIKKIDGYTNLHEKLLKQSRDSLSLFHNFCITNNRLPSVFSSNINEKKLAEKITSSNMLFTKEQKKKFKSLKNKFVSNDLFELIYYGFYVNINERNVEDFKLKLDEYLNKYDYINSNIMQFLKKNEMFSNFYIKKIDSSKLLNKKVVIKFFNDNKRFPMYNLDNFYEVKIFLSLMNDNLLRNKKFNEPFYEMYLNLNNVADKLNEFIIENHRYPNKDDTEMYELYNNYRDMLSNFGFVKCYDNFLKLYTKEAFIESLILFIHNHNGEEPSINGVDKEEISLAEEFLRYKVSTFNEDDKIRIETEMKRSRVGNNFLKEYIIFLKNNKRYPNIKSKNLDEVDLAVRYFRNEKYLTAKDKKLIKNSVKISRSQLFRNTYFYNID